jgi:hypothetical protein
MPKDPGTTIWALRRDGQELACVVRLEPHGVEIDLTRNGALSVTRSFHTSDEALAWADRKRTDREGQGWTRV